MDTRQDTETRKLTTADLAAASQQRVQTERSAREEQRQPRPSDANAAKREEELAALFVPDAANGFRSQWDAVQIGFVDDPARAVREADELVA